MKAKKVLQVRIKQTTLNELKKVANQKEETVSEYVRKLLENHLLSR